MPFSRDVLLDRKNILKIFHSLSSLCQNLSKHLQGSSPDMLTYWTFIMAVMTEDFHRHPANSVIPSVSNSSCELLYSSVWGWITEESDEMPFKDFLPGLQSPRGLSDMPTHCLLLHLTPGAVIYSLSCCCSSFPPSLPDPLSRTVSEFTESQLSYSEWRSQWL